jgi:predicted HTH transcriptional regulator
LSAPGRTLTWSAARQSLGQADEGATRQLAARLQQQLERGGATHIVRVSPRGCALVPKRFVHLRPVASIPRSRQRVLAILAERPGVGAAELGDRLGMQQRTLRRHLQALCAQGLVRRVGGGRETRYLAI